MNHLAMTLSAEEPEITSVSIRPGVIDTEMQRVVREHNTVMDPDEAERFKSLYEGGKLLRPEQPGHVIAKLSVEADKELSGKFLR
jgi:NAD(P)-dependent dehydrogenase (short-subunit alcohol dehydrogenase family)